MMNLDGFGFESRLGTLRSAETFALEQSIAIHCANGDLRWALIALAAQSFTAAVASGKRRLAAWARNALQRVRFVPPADTMVAAGGR